MTERRDSTDDDIRLARDLIARACELLEEAGRPIVAAHLFYPLGLIEAEFGPASPAEVAITQSR
jgi:hypothetical protein